MDSDEAQVPGDDRRRLLEQLPPSTPLTLERAAYLASYRSSSSLRRAAREGRLHVDRHGPRNVLTTAGALLSYLATLHTKGAARGQPRKGQDAGGDKAGE